MLPIGFAKEVNADTQEKIDEAIQNVPGTAGTLSRANDLSMQPVAASLLPVVTEVGKISWSIDGLGVYPDTAGIIQVEKPAGSTVRSAYMAAATTGFSGYQLQPGDIKIDGADVLWTKEIANSISSYNYWADVTSLVKAKIDTAPAGRVDFTITETPAHETDGEMLVVIFDDPAQKTDNTIILMFGAQDTTGDNFNIFLAKPIDLNDPNLALDFSLASSYSYQEGLTGQYSIVDVNGIRMTSSAGGDDDGTGERSNGELFTVGGLDDSTDNPADPNALPDYRRYDDELYTLLPFVSNGDTSILVHTLNPSNDDNLLFAGLFLTVVASIQDFGDAPNSYHTLLASNAARHTIVDGVHLGQLIDGELDGQPSPDAKGDDTNNLGDEDGVIFTIQLSQGSASTVQVIASAAGRLNAWIDFNNDGDWADANEQIFKDESLVPGSNTLTFDVPSNAATGYTYARFRFDTKGGLFFDGSADDGEVEDYAIKITPVQPPTPVESQPDTNFESIEIGSDLARAMNGGSKLHTLAINNLEIKKNQDSGECECCPTCSNYRTKYNKEMITIGNRGSMAIGFASATNNIKVLTNQQ